MSIQKYTIDSSDILDGLKRKDHVLVPMPVGGKIPDGEDGFGLVNRCQRMVGGESVFGPGDLGETRTAEMDNGVFLHVVYCYDWIDKGWPAGSRENCYKKVLQGLDALYEELESSENELVRPVRSVFLGAGYIGQQDHYTYQWSAKSMLWTLSNTELPLNIYDVDFSDFETE